MECDENAELDTSQVDDQRGRGGYIVKLTDADIADGLDAAASVGDDRIQSQVQSPVSCDTFSEPV